MACADPARQRGRRRLRPRGGRAGVRRARRLWSHPARRGWCTTACSRTWPRRTASPSATPCSASTPRQTRQGEATSRTSWPSRCRRGAQGRGVGKELLEHAIDQAALRAAAHAGARAAAVGRRRPTRARARMFDAVRLPVRRRRARPLRRRPAGAAHGPTNQGSRGVLSDSRDCRLGNASVDEDGGKLGQFRCDLLHARVTPHPNVSKQSGVSRSWA